MNIYCRCLRGKKNQTKLKKKKLFKLACVDVYLLFDQLWTWYWFYCRLSGGRHHEDMTARAAKKKDEKQSVVGWFVFVSSLCCVSVFSVDWGSSWVKVQITWRRIGPPAFTLPARRGSRGEQTQLRQPTWIQPPSPPPPLNDGGPGSWLSVF